MITNNRHLEFIEEYLANGMNARQAYLKAYPKASISTADVNGAKLLSNAKVQSVIEEKKQELAERNNYVKDESVAILASIARNEMKRDGDRIKAVSELNKMLGFNAPTETNINMNIEQPLFSDDDLGKNE